MGKGEDPTPKQKTDKFQIQTRKGNVFKTNAQFLKKTELQIEQLLLASTPTSGLAVTGEVPPSRTSVTLN